MKTLFVESSFFTKKIGLEKDRILLRRIQNEIIDNPSKGVSIPGAGGVKKIRVSRANEGKSGGYRVFYLDLQEHGIVHLLFFITKGEKDNITNSERNELKAAADFLKKVAKQRK